ncbi:MAG: pyridoxal phosphate-dependent aminotransferase [Firmicutes bacterium]|nr:pyridoxal phosphate-dependent aminotransferase [Bacillota bacterium]
MVSEKMLGLGNAPSPILVFSALGKAREKEVGKENIFNFSLGAPAVPMPEEFRQELIRLLNEEDRIGLHTYLSPGGDEAAKTAIAEDLNRRFGTNYTCRNIFMTAGAAPAIAAVLNAVKAGEDDELALIAPYFTPYRIMAEGAGLKVVEIRTLEPDFRLDLDAIEKALTPRTACLILNSPNNPSGMIYPSEDIKKLAEILEKKSEEFGRPIFLLSDEPYREILLDDVEVPFTANFYRNTIICYSYSKSLSIAGERVGYVLIPSENEDFAKLYPAVSGAASALGVSTAPSLFQKALVKCAHMQSDNGLYRKNRDLLYSALTGMGYVCTRPQGTFYMMVKTLGEETEFCRRAAGMGLILVPCGGFGFPGYVRVALCVPEDVAARSVAAFKKLKESYEK